jgi:hypothetical protein
MGDGTVELKEPLSVQELMIVVDKAFPHGLMWQTLCVTISELRRLQDRVDTLENLMSE